MANEKTPGGYNGKILRVNLTTGKITIEEIDDAFCRKYLGGAGFIAYYLLKELKQGVDALGPDNKLIFAAGPLTGIRLSGCARHCVGAKSPLTNTIAKSAAGEFWGAELKAAGFDGYIGKPVDAYTLAAEVNFWFEGPDFQKRHEYRPAQTFDPKNYSDNFLTYVGDFNGDGWPDVLYVPIPGTDAYWY